MNLAKVLIEADSKYFTKVLDLILKIQSEQSAELEKKFQKFSLENPADNDSGYGWGDYLSDLNYDNERTEQILYKSFIVSIVMFMESRLLQLCEHLKKEFGHKFSVYDLKHTGITRSIYYLKVLGINFPKNSATNQDFSLAFRIRNSLVHADGKIGGLEELNKILGNNKKAKQYISMLYSELQFTPAYLKSLIDLNEKICDEISENWLVKKFP